MNFFAVKVDEVTSKWRQPRNKTSLQIPGLTSFPIFKYFIRQIALFGRWLVIQQIKLKFGYWKPGWDGYVFRTYPLDKLSRLRTTGPWTLVIGTYSTTAIYGRWEVTCIAQGSVVRRPDSAIHWIAIFSTFVKLAVDRYNLRLKFGIYKLKFLRSIVGSRSVVSQLFG